MPEKNALGSFTFSFSFFHAKVKKKLAGCTCFCFIFFIFISLCLGGKCIGRVGLPQNMSFSSRLSMRIQFPVLDPRLFSPVRRQLVWQSRARGGSAGSAGGAGCGAGGGGGPPRPGGASCT